MAEDTRKNATLSQLRQEIDTIDAQLHHLLKARDEVTKQVERAKGLSGGRSAIRPSREAEMMIRLKNNHNSQFTFSSLEHIWREIIAVSTRKQSPFRVHVASHSLRYRDLVRFQFGVSTPIDSYEETEQALLAVKQNLSDIALIPLSAKGAWWQNQLDGQNLMVISRIPYFKGILDLPEAFLIADVEPEETQDDCTLVLATTPPEQGQYDIIASDPHANSLLIELEGYLTAKECETKGMTKLGAYPRQCIQNF